MSTLTIETAGGRTEFQPGEKVVATLQWLFDLPPESIEVRLVWYTQGKGDTDVQIVDRVGFENPSHNESRQCAFSLPEGPYSFSGKLISLVWALEVLAEPSGESTRLDITVAPGGREVLLQSEIDE